MTLAFDLYWSFRSPYCYLALPRILEIHREYDVEVQVRPIYPIAVRDRDFFKHVHPNYRRYHLLDSKRVAEYLGIPYRRPVPDPIVQDMQTNAIAAEQPFIYRLTRLGMAAALAGRGLRFLEEVSPLLWDGSVDNWHEGTHLANALRRASLDPDALEREITTGAAKLDRSIQDNHDALVAAGHWGVPTTVFDGEPFFGQDRIELLLWRMKQRGLEQRQRART
jgi:2-hydroxychromene-2-carboxylate isomerase